MLFLYKCINFSWGKTHKIFWKQITERTFYSTDEYVDFWQLSIITDVHYNLDWCLMPVISNYFGLAKERFLWKCVYLVDNPFCSFPNWGSAFDMSLYLLVFSLYPALCSPPCIQVPFQLLHVKYTQGELDISGLRKLSNCLSTSTWHVI